jgi:DNA-binding XRE family transcriptional regulator
MGPGRRRIPNNTRPHNSRLVAQARHGAIKFPNRIAEYRRARVMKITTLASRVGCTPSHLWKVEHGQKVPSAMLLHDVARTLGVLVDALYDRDWSWQRKKQLA